MDAAPLPRAGIQQSIHRQLQRPYVDVDGDDYPDVASVSWFAKRVAWWRNPGKAGGEWKAAPIHEGFNVEFAILADMDNDGKANEIVAQENGTGQAWYEVKDKAWVAHVVSAATYGHGIGAGDVNGDKRNDILTPRGWLEAPADPRAGNWTFHPDWESLNVPATPPATPPKPDAPPRVSELGFMHVMDVNGDGRNDVITASGHDYGVYWFEQGEGGKWTRRVIDSAWSQGHASTLVDLNGDGRLDFVTGKRFMAHNGSDPGEKEPLGVYWYESRKGSGGRRVDPPHHRLRWPHGRRHADPRRRHRSRRRPGSRVRRQERAVRRREPDEVGEALMTGTRKIRRAPFLFIVAGALFALGAVRDAFFPHFFTTQERNPAGGAGIAVVFLAIGAAQLRNRKMSEAEGLR